MLFTLLACADAGTDVAYTEADLLADIDGYASWAQPASWPALEPSCDAAHGGYVRIYLNPAAVADLAAGAALGDGAVVVEAGFQDTLGTPKMVVAARRVEGYGATYGDWYRAILDERGEEVSLGGRIDACLACHNEAEGWVRSSGESPPESRDDCPKDTGGFYPL